MGKNKKKRELIEEIPQCQNPSIAEALCEIHFTIDKEDFENSIKKLKKAFQPLYQDPQEKKIKQYHAQIKEVGVSINETPILFWIFKHKERNHLIQVFPHMISVNELEKYPGWKVFSSDLSFAWDAVKKAFSVASIKHIRLRYINLIPQKKIDEPLSQWLQPNRYYPDGILDSTAGFVSRSEFNIEETRRLIVTVAESIQNNHEKGFIFDIDTIMKINENIDWEEMLEKIDSLHTLVSNVFFSSIARKYESFLKGENS